jgi:hypothetical protein
MLLTPPLALAADNGNNNTGTVDCGDPNTKNACIECCTYPNCGIVITCCPLIGPCTIVNNASSASSPLKLTQVAGGLMLQFQRTIKPDGVDVKLKVSFLKKIFPRGANVRVRLTGADAQLSGLLYPVLFLGQGDPIATLHAAGYDVTAGGTFTTCQSLFPAQLCSDMAIGLSRNIQAGLGVGIRTEFNAFMDAVNTLGYGPCQIIL